MFSQFESGMGKVTNKANHRRQSRVGLDQADPICEVVVAEV